MMPRFRLALDTNHHRLVGQLVLATCVGRKVLREFPRHGLNSLDYASLELVAPEVTFHVVADLFPALRTDMGVDAAIGVSTLWSANNR
jgi:hypothetical protein